MKFTNIDDAIMEAAKKVVPAKPVKAAKKAEAQKKAALPAKKATAPKKAEAPTPAPKKKTAVPAPVTPKKASAKKKTAAVQATEPEKKEEEPVKEPEQKPAETKPASSTDSGEPRKFAPRWLQSKPRGLGDRLKTAWKGFTAKAGDKIDVPHKYKSVFHEIQKLMEQLQLVESMLREQSLNESYDAGTVNNLYAHRDALRGVLAEQMIREELYKHNVTLTELNKNERTALIETIKQRSDTMWGHLAEMQSVSSDTVEEGKLSRLAAGLGLGAAAMMGGAKDAEAQSTTPQQTVTAPVPNDSVQTGVSRDMGLAQTKAGFELDRRGIDRQGARMTPKQNPDGTWSVTIDARKQPTTGTPQMEESYTLDEWMGMMKEAGLNLDEGPVSYLHRSDKKHPDGYSAGDDELPPRSKWSRRYRPWGESPPDATPFDPTAHDPYYANVTPIPAKSPKLNPDMDTVDVGDMADTDSLSIGKVRTRKITDPNWKKMANRLRKANPSPNLEESGNETYTLEEWMGMMEEAGYSLEEGMAKVRNKQKKNKVVANRGVEDFEKYPHAKHSREYHKAKTAVTGDEGDISLKSLKPSSVGDKGETIDKMDRLAKKQGRKYFKKNDDEEKTSVSENTVARLQELAGIQPLNG